MYLNKTSEKVLRLIARGGCKSTAIMQAYPEEYQELITCGYIKHDGMSQLGHICSTTDILITSQGRSCLASINNSRRILIMNTVLTVVGIIIATLALLKQ